MDPKREGNVLVVDDDRNAVDILERLLIKEGFAVQCAHGGREALAAVAAHPIDVILLDVMMPGMDGFQVCEALRKDERTREIPVILLTAKDDMETRVVGMRLGVSEFLTKPINKTELFQRLRAQLHQRSIEHRIDDMLSS
ncbi:MAG: response regulator [Deltaproteobacteria bacterium]|nr:response regulator [Deltaproteobacteria bacterium]